MRNFSLRALLDPFAAADERLALVAEGLAAGERIVAVNKRYVTMFPHLAGIALPPLWSLAAGVIDALHHALAWMGQAPSATWSAPVAPWWAQISGLAAGALVVAPLPWRARAFALPLALPLLLPVVDRPVPGSYEVIAADVGQGTAVLVRTATKLMLFDTGPAYARERNAGERVLLPLLRARGETRIDHLVLSHQDIDHVAGAPALIDALPVGTLWSSLPDAHALRGRGLAHRACEAGASWQWDGVRFEVLHPIPGAVAVDMPAPKPNALSCVVRVIDAQGHALLIAGDIEGGGLLKRIDFLSTVSGGGYTGSMFGHSPAPVAKAIREQATQGLTYMLSTADAPVVADELAKRFGLPFWQVTSTASEANRARTKL